MRVASRRIMPVSKPALLISLVLHAIAFLLGVTTVVLLEFHPNLRLAPVVLVEPAPPPPKLRLARASDGGGGGGGHDVLPASRGALPKPAPKQWIPPAADPKPSTLTLTLAPTLEIPPDVQVAVSDASHYGDPLSKYLVLSSGSGDGGGIGNRGCCGGIGNKKGPGYGDGDRPGGIYARLTTASQLPVLLFRVDPDYSEEARKARHQGVVVLAVMVDLSGRPSEIRVLRSLGLGLDEKAVEAVSHWKFRPGLSAEGRPMPSPAMIEVNFRLL